MKDIRGGIEYYDGTEISTYNGRFGGTFEIDRDLGMTMVMGDLHTFLVTARQAKRAFPKDKALPGCVKQDDTFQIQEVLAIDADRARFMYDGLGLQVVGVNELPETSRAERGTEEGSSSLFSEGDFLPVEDLHHDADSQGLLEAADAGYLEVTEEEDESLDLTDVLGKVQS